MSKGVFFAHVMVILLGESFRKMGKVCSLILLLQILGLMMVATTYLWLYHSFLGLVIGLHLYGQRRFPR